MTISRRMVLASFAALALSGAVAGPARADSARQTAEGFVDALIAASESDSLEAAEAAFARYVDMAFVADAALTPQAVEAMTPDQMRRLIPAMQSHLAQQAVSMMGYGGQGNISWGSERARGTGVEVTARFTSRERELGVPSAGIPIKVYVGDHSRSGAPAVRDMGFGDDWVSAGLGRTLYEIAEHSPDPEVWIAALEPLPDVPTPADANE